ncbi:MAG: hypothetical protein ABSE82_08665 [Nitrososphaerales archaeon]
MPRNRRFFYFLIIVSIIVALFYSVLLGLIVFVADIAYFFYLGRSVRRSGNHIYGEMPDEPAVQRETIIQREVVKIPCKYCKTLMDPVRDKACPNCGAPIDLT